MPSSTEIRKYQTRNKFNKIKLKQTKCGLTKTVEREKKKRYLKRINTIRGNNKITKCNTDENTFDA